MTYINKVKSQTEIITNILNDKYEYVGGLSVNIDENNIKTELWYKNLLTNNGVIIDFNNDDIEDMRIARAEEFEEFCNSFDGKYLVKNQKTR